MPTCAVKVSSLQSMMGTPLFALLRPPPPRLTAPDVLDDRFVGNVSRSFCDVKGFSVYPISPPPKVTVPPLPLRRATNEDAVAPTGSEGTATWP